MARTVPASRSTSCILGHDFRSCAARLSLAGTNHAFDDRVFWLSLLYAMLGGMADALGIEAGDINGVIRPIGSGSEIIQEVVIFDDVPGGAGHALRLQDEGELLSVLRAAHARVANCTCDTAASCYTCLRSYRNQFCHDLLARGAVADYLGLLIEAVSAAPDEDQPYLLPDTANALRAAVRDNGWVAWVADRLTDGGPPEIGPWYVLLLEFVSRPGNRLRLALRQGRNNVPTAGTGLRVGEPFVPLLALYQAGAELFRFRDDAPPPPYGLVACSDGGPSGKRGVAFHWDPELRTTSLDGETHLRRLWSNRSSRRMPGIVASTDAWFQKHAVPLTIREVLPTSEGCKVHAIKKDQGVNFTAIFRTLVGSKVQAIELQDPYLMTMHQVDCLGDFLRAIPWSPIAEEIPFKLLTHLSDSDPSERDRLPVARQREEIDRCFSGIKMLKPEVQFRYKKLSPLHMRYVLVSLLGDRKLLYILERGLDMKDPRSGSARADTFVLEFSHLPPAFAPILRL